MKKKKIGFVLFWFALVWSVLWGIAGSVWGTSFLHGNTMEELKQTVWSPEGPFMIFWGICGVPLGALLGSIGILLYSNIKGSVIWKVGVGVLIVIFVALFNGLGHIPALFGVGGSIILICFFGILWFWTKERMRLTDRRLTAADLKLVGFIFLLLAAWFICGALSQPFLKAFKGEPTYTPLHIMIFMVLGWIFLFLGHYKWSKQEDHDNK